MSKGVKIAYIRVSTIEQNTARQIEALKPYDITKTFEEKISGKDSERPQLKELMKYVREGDTIYIESISRLARNTLDFIKIVEELQTKGVGLVSLKETIDTSTPQGRFMLNVFASLSQLERETILEKQREGIEAAKARGQQLGRPKIEVDKQFKSVYQSWKTGDITARAAMDKLGMKANTFYRRVKELEANK